MINIMGTEYDIIKQPYEGTKLEVAEANGLFEGYSKKLIINSGIIEPDPEKFENVELFEDKVLRHEVYHAVFHESGLSKYVADETLIEFLALQHHKIVEIIKQAEELLQKDR